MPRERVQALAGLGRHRRGRWARRHQLPCHRQCDRGEGRALPTRGSSPPTSCCATRAPTSPILRLKSVKEELATLPFADHDDLAVGDLVLAIGNPFGVGQTVTSGIVSALARTNVGVTNFQSFIQTDAAINPGNSGGALVDMEGRLVGINTSIFSRSGGSIGIGFAIPSAMVRVVVDSAKAGSSRVLRPWLGADLQNVTPDIAESLGLERPAGALVAEVARVGPVGAGGTRDRRRDPRHRRRGGLRPGRFRLSLRDPAARRHGQGRGAAGPASARTRRHRARHRRGDDTARRGQGRRALAARRRDDRQPVAGCRGCAGLQFDADGVVIIDVEENSTAASLGFQKKDVLVQVNGQPATSSKADHAGPVALALALAGDDQPRRAADLLAVRRVRCPTSSPPPDSTATRRGRSPTGCARPRSPRSSARITSSGPTVR